MNSFLTGVVFLMSFVVLVVMSLAIWESFSGERQRQDAKRAFQKALIEKTLREIEGRKKFLGRG